MMALMVAMMMNENVIVTLVREGSRYQIGEFLEKFQKAFDPPPSVLENYVVILYNGYGCIYARRYKGQIV